MIKTELRPKCYPRGNFIHDDVADSSGMEFSLYQEDISQMDLGILYELFLIKFKLYT